MSKPPETEDGRTFPMRVVTRMTGLSADVVRVWERRHQAIEPDRTEGNARRYSAADITRLARLRDAVAAGHSISSIARLSDERLADISRDLARSVPQPVAYEAYLDAIVQLELARAEAILNRHAQLVRPRELVLEFIAPLLRDVGERWHDGRFTIPQEHAVSSQVRTLLSTLVRSASLPVGAPRIVVATPPGQRHELGAQMAAVLATERGVAPVYLGADVPWADLAPACKTAGAKVLLITALIASPESARRAENCALETLAKDVEVWVGAPAGHPFHRVDGVRGLPDFAAYEAALTHRFGV